MTGSVFTPPNAPVVVLLFLFTALLAVAGAAAAGWLAFRGRTGPAKRIAEGLAVIFVLYGGTLLAHSFTSRDRILEPGQLKYFCEIDCHLAYSVEGVRVAKVLGSGPAAATARGQFTIVTIKTWFDPKTISARRGEGPLRPNPRTIRLEDAAGRAYSPSHAGQSALDPLSNPDQPLDHPLRPGESVSTDLVFDLPDSTPGSRLLISEDISVAPFIVSHENSLFHRKIWFRVPPASADGMSRHRSDVREACFDGVGPLRVRGSDATLPPHGDSVLGSRPALRSIQAE
ncbi:MAG TPA: hypothetical protein VGR38_07435 [Candidatus Polarisedimenticolia bacterium]|nr:hypothetical protein [Candidatus Polarisedimenticolia bacterium]